MCACRTPVMQAEQAAPLQIPAQATLVPSPASKDDANAVQASAPPTPPDITRIQHVPSQAAHTTSPDSLPPPAASLQDGAVQTSHLQAAVQQTVSVQEGSAQTAGHLMQLRAAPTSTRARPWDTSEELLDGVMHQLRHQFHHPALPGYTTCPLHLKGPIAYLSAYLSKLL